MEREQTRQNQLMALEKFDSLCKRIGQINFTVSAMLIFASQTHAWEMVFVTLGIGLGHGHLNVRNSDNISRLKGEEPNWP